MRFMLLALRRQEQDHIQRGSEKSLIEVSLWESMCIIIVEFYIAYLEQNFNCCQSQQPHNEGLMKDDYRLNITPDDVIMLFQTCTITDQVMIL